MKTNLLRLSAVVLLISCICLIMIVDSVPNRLLFGWFGLFATNMILLMIIVPRLPKKDFKEESPTFDSLDKIPAKKHTFPPPCAHTKQTIKDEEGTWCFCTICNLEWSYSDVRKHMIESFKEASQDM